MTTQNNFHHESLDCGIEFAADELPHRQTVTLAFRMLVGTASDPLDLTGIGGIVERTLSKGTRKYDGQGLADAFDAIGAQWSSSCGRQSTLVRVVCLPEFTLDVVDLVAEMIAKPTFPDDACEVAVQLALEDLTHMEDDPQSLLQIDMQKAALGPIFGRHPGGEADTLPRITPPKIRAHWKHHFHAGRMQVVAAGAINPGTLAKKLNQEFKNFGDATRSGRDNCTHAFAPSRVHREKDLKQQYIGISLRGLAKSDPRFQIEQVLLGILAGGMSARLFTEVREKQGLVYWVGAWHEQPRGMGLMHMGASTTPERCEKTYKTLLRELERISEDVTDEELHRAVNQIIAHAETEDDLTRARAAGLSDDLFHFGKPVGIESKLDAIRTVTLTQVREYARQLERDKICIATVGPKPLA